MARGSRFTVRLADWEIQSVRRFADENHLLPSVAVRWLLSAGLASEARSRPQNVHQKQVSSRPAPIG
jgi:hypothetical protein